MLLVNSYRQQVVEDRRLITGTNKGLRFLVPEGFTILLSIRETRRQRGINNDIYLPNSARHGSVNRQIGEAGVDLVEQLQRTAQAEGWNDCGPTVLQRPLEHGSQSAPLI